MQLRSRLGYSLVELMIVISIIAVMSGYGMLSFQRILPHIRTDKASSRLAFQLQLARSEAIAVNQMVYVELNPSTNIFSTWMDLNRNGSKDVEEIKEVLLIEPALVKIRSDWENGMFNAFGQFILTPGQREIKTVSTFFSAVGNDASIELTLRGSGAVTKR